MLRHSNPQLTMNIYARTREGRLADVTENVGRVVMAGHERASSGHQVALKWSQKENGGKKSDSVSEDESEDCDPESMAERAGFEPAVRYERTHAFQACSISHSDTSPLGLQSIEICAGTGQGAGAGHVGCRARWRWVARPGACHSKGMSGALGVLQCVDQV